VRFEEVESFIADFVGRCFKLGAKMTCNKRSKDMCVYMTVPSDEEMGEILGSTKEMEAKGMYRELIKVYQKVRKVVGLY